MPIPPSPAEILIRVFGPIVAACFIFAVFVIRLVWGLRAPSQVYIIISSILIGILVSVSLGIFSGFGDGDCSDWDKLFVEKFLGVTHFSRLPDYPRVVLCVGWPLSGIYETRPIALDPGSIVIKGWPLYAPLIIDGIIWAIVVWSVMSLFRRIKLRRIAPNQGHQTRG